MVLLISHLRKIKSVFLWESEAGNANVATRNGSLPVRELFTLGNGSKIPQGVENPGKLF
jgi:hypothetical protein